MTSSASNPQKSNVVEEATVGEKPLQDPEATCSTDSLSTSPWRRGIITAGICLCHFLITIEITIVNTSLVSIADDLGDFKHMSWVATAYLLTYVGFLIIIAKLGEIVGLKTVLVSSMIMFTVWAGICGAAQTTVQLIVFRALQGVGAAGVFSSAIIVPYHLFPAQKIPKIVSLISAVLAVSLVLGPILGGAINESGTWRWIFLFNVPFGAVAAVIFITLIPNGFPHHRVRKESSSQASSAMKRILRRMDFLGAFCLLGASVLLVAALENAATYPWTSGQVLPLLIISSVLWISFLGWEWHVTRQNSAREAIFPWRLVSNRGSFGFLLTSFLLGPPSVVAIFSIPQRFQVVNGASALEAGVRLLPYTAITPVSSMLASTICGKGRVPPLYVILVASLIQITGFALLAYTPITTSIYPGQYGYQVLAALGCGANMTLLTIMTRYMVSGRDYIVTQGTVGQLRYLGGVLGIALVTFLSNHYEQRKLAGVLTLEQIRMIQQTSAVLDTMSEDVQHAARLVFASAYNLHMKVLIGFSAAQIPAALLMWKNPQVRLGVAYQKN